MQRDDASREDGMDKTEIRGLPLIGPDLAAELMRAGQPVIFPTETFFGLGSRALDADASARVFRAKRRSTVRPLPIILGEWEQLDLITKAPDSVMPLLRRFWPGPLSIIFPARLRVPDILTGGTGRVAVRLSAHPAARALARAVGEPISASSANISGTPAVTVAADLDPELVAAVSGVLNAPPAPAGGLASTLAEYLGDNVLRLLRDGPVTRADLEEAGFCVERTTPA